MGLKVKDKREPNEISVSHRVCSIRFINFTFFAIMPYLNIPLPANKEAYNAEKIKLEFYSGYNIALLVGE